MFATCSCCHPTLYKWNCCGYRDSVKSKYLRESCNGRKRQIKIPARIMQWAEASNQNTCENHAMGGSVKSKYLRESCNGRKRQIKVPARIMQWTEASNQNSSTPGRKRLLYGENLKETDGLARFPGRTCSKLMRPATEAYHWRPQIEVWLLFF